MSRANERSETTTGSVPLHARLAVDADVAAGCPLQGRDLADVRQSFVHSTEDETPVCRVAVDDRGAIDYHRTTPGSACPCSILARADCIADLQSVSEGRFLFSVVVPDRAVLRSVVDELRSAVGSVSVERLSAGSADDESPGEPVALTEKQREVLALAVDEGYYDRPREATLDDLAAELGITRSAVSQRLTAIERKLIRERARYADGE